jgi:hypothetical protein
MVRKQQEERERIKKGAEDRVRREKEQAEREQLRQIQVRLWTAYV